MNKKNVIIPPVALIIFNRPEYTRRAFEAIRKVQPAELFVIADGGRTENEWQKCHEARAIVDRVDWPCTVHKNFADQNMGVRKRIESGITWVFQHVDRAVILEDDCVADPTFFPFCGELLEKYKDDGKIMMISGDNPMSHHPIADSYTFSKYFAIWGWATWKRAWNQYDSNMKSWEERKKQGLLFKTLAHRGVTHHLTELFDKAFKHEIDSWATRWFYTCLWSGGLSIVPRVNLVSNIGIEGVHSSPGINNNVPNHSIDTTLVHPKEIKWNRSYDLVFFAKTFPWRPIPNPRVLILKNLVKAKRIVRKILFKLTGVITLKPAGRVRGHVLLSYISIPFLRPHGILPISHTNEWECFEIAKIFLENNFVVDVIEWNNATFKPKKKYDFLIDIHENIARLSSLLDKNCVKIFHITGAHWKFMNNAEATRLQALKDRRGITLPPGRTVPPSLNIEHSDLAISLGNKFTWNTYAFAGKPVLPVPISTPLLFDFPQKRNTSEAKKNFIWFGGTGFVHKGLDLVLEAFVKMPEYNLTVIGPIHKEKAFEQAFYKELYETPNIKTVGWLSIDSQKFQNITTNSIALVYPSCSEGGGGSVITCMHAGLIPIVTYESSVSVEDFGIILPDATIESIRSRVTEIASSDNTTLIERSKKAWEYARTHHTRATFADTYRKTVTNILKQYGK